MATSNKAAWLMTKQQKPFEVAEAPTPEPAAHEVLIKVGAIAINPVDAAIQNLGLLWDTYPLILGSDLAGEVVKVGAEVTRIKVSKVVGNCMLSLRCSTKLESTQALRLEADTDETACIFRGTC